MRGYFTSDNEILAYDDKKTEPSFHELSQIYKPSKKQTHDTLRALYSSREDIKAERQKVEDNLRPKVRNADLEFAVALVGAGLFQKELEKVEYLIVLNEFLLQRSDADEVKNIPISDFLQFDRQGFTRCIFHNERTASLKYYKRDNRVHCFAGCGQKNVIQVYAQLNNLSNRDAYFQLKDRLA